MMKAARQEFVLTLLDKKLYAFSFNVFTLSTKYLLLVINNSETYLLSIQMFLVPSTMNNLVASSMQLKNIVETMLNNIEI